jgi:heat shock protein HslJ
MAGPPELMKQENQFLTALPQTTRFSLFGQKLIFENTEKGIRLEFAEHSE